MRETVAARHARVTAVFRSPLFPGETLRRRKDQEFARRAAVQNGLDRHELEGTGMKRRTLVTAGPLIVSACGHRDEAYFGKTTPPSEQRLVFEIQGEPETLDPAKTS